MEMMYLKDRRYVIIDAFSQISPLEPESAEKVYLDAILVHHIMLEISATEAWPERTRGTMQAGPILSHLKHQNSRDGQMQGEAFQKASTHSGTTGMSYW